MRIRKLHEMNELDEISSDRIDEINRGLNGISQYVIDKKEFIQSLIGELDKFGSMKKSNDQIDDTIITLELVKKSIEDIISNLDVAEKNLRDYKENGRKYLYK